MLIPESIRVGSCFYNVELTDEPILLGNQLCYGLCDTEKHEITVNTNLQDIQGQEKTFLHELFHAMVNERSLDLENSDTETIVDELAIALHQVILDNPEIFIFDKFEEEYKENGQPIFSTKMEI